MADYEMLWPLRAVSEDPTNVTKLDAENKVLTSTTDIAATFVQKAGDEMTGPLIVRVPSQTLVSGQIQVFGESLANVTLSSCGNTSTETPGLGNTLRSLRSRGTTAAPEDVGDKDVIFSVAGQAYIFGAYRPCGNFRYEVDGPAQAGDTFARTRFIIGTGSGTVQGSTARLLINSAGHVGIGTVTPTHRLEVGGDSMLRGPLEVTGNITSAGTAHSFAAGSIPSSAVIGNTPRTIADTSSAGVAGQMVWDADFLYVHTGATGWKKVALTTI